jgi:hypothetical protein
MTEVTNGNVMLLKFKLIIMLEHLARIVVRIKVNTSGESIV